MIPPLIIEKAISDGINLLAITDHNATANIEAVRVAAIGTDITVLSGMELQTSEEIHVICLFDEPDQAYALQKIVDQALPPLPNNIDFFGEQFIVDNTGDFIRREERLLLASTSLSLSEAWDAVANLGGLLIPAHVNRKAYGLIPTLGFVPTDIPIEILEISSHINPLQAPISFPQIKGYPLIQSGDAHFLEDILALNVLTLDKPTISEIRKAIMQIGDNTHTILPRTPA